MEKVFDVFLSYHSLDRPAVLRVKDALQAHGLKVWLDQDQIRPGDLFVGALEEGLQSSKAVAFFISPGAMKSGWLREEYSRALVLANSSQDNVRLVPVILRHSPMPAFITTRQSVDLSDESLFEERIERLVWGLTGKRPSGSEIGSSGTRASRFVVSKALAAKLAVGLLLLIVLGFIGWRVSKDSRKGAPAVGKDTLSVLDFETVVLDEGGAVVERFKRTASYYSEDLGDGVELRMVKVDGDTFQMGTPQTEVSKVADEFSRYPRTRDEKQKYAKWILRETPQHSVTVPDFFIGMYEVTQQQWRAVARLPKVNRDVDSNPSKFKGDRRPVESISWLDAVEFCQRLALKTGKNYRLPTESEWEYAARAKTTTPFAFGRTITTQYVNYEGRFPFGGAPLGNNLNTTNEVGKYTPNGFGIYDMHGNVWEWCSDLWHPNYAGAPADGRSWTENGEYGSRVIRGGTYWWFAVASRSAVRSILLEDSKEDENGDHGFRVALSN
jgi:formylglycine-generating enzyme required for sulfatase activity